MPVFGSKKQRSPESSPHPAPEPQPSASERLNTLLSEQAELESTIASHREERSRLLRESDAPGLGAITALATQTDQAKLRLEWIEHQLPGLRAQVERERREEFEAAWQSHRPILAAAEVALTEATQAFLVALEQANTAYGRAGHFGERLREFVRPPPTVIFNEWSLREYLKAIEARRQQPLVVSAPLLELTVEAPLDLPPPQRFVPRRVPVAELERISAIAEPRRVRIVQGPVRTANLQLGVARMFPGEEHNVPARAAYALVMSGIAVYIDVETAEAATAA